MSPRDDDHIGQGPKITPAHDEIASYRSTQGRGAFSSSLGEVPEVPSGGSSSVIKIVVTALTVLLLATATWAGMLHNKLQGAEKALRNYGGRIAELEQRLSVTDESMSESGVAMKVKLREMDSEIRKLWDNVWKKQKQQLAEQAKQLQADSTRLKKVESFVATAKTQQAKTDKVVAGLSTELKNTQRMQVKVAANESKLALQNSSLESTNDKLNGITSSVNTLNRRVKETEEWVESINGFRRQVNRDINTLRQGVGQAQGGASQ